VTAKKDVILSGLWITILYPSAAKTFATKMKGGGGNGKAKKESSKEDGEAPQDHEA
jgi:hypothetical protein